MIIYETLVVCKFIIKLYIINLLPVEPVDQVDPVLPVRPVDPVTNNN